MALPRAQELTEYITFMNTTVPKSASGTATQTTEYASAKARIEETGGRGPEEETMQHQSQTLTFEVITQYIDGIKAWMEIAWGTRTLTIIDAPQKIKDGNGRNWLIIQAEEYSERSLS